MLRWRVTHRANIRISHTSCRSFSRSDAVGPRNGESVVIAMSGGVDSSVAAALLAEKDYDLSAVFMRNWDSRDEHASESGCEWERDWVDVQKTCSILRLPCRMVDLSKEYWLRVFEPSISEWERGNTPNPDVACNKEVKFGALLQHIPAHAWIATGHYGVISRSPSEPPKLMRAADDLKDQTYYLSSLSSCVLRRSLLPIGHLSKGKVREIAESRGLPSASREESMGICFVGERTRFHKFLSQYIPQNSGNIVSSEGDILGRHDGLWTHTIGQRARFVSSAGHKWFVSRKDPERNEIVVVPSSSHPALMSNSCTVERWNWIWEQPPEEASRPEGMPVRTQIRRRMLDVPANLRQTGNGTYSLMFDEPQHAIAPGQIAVVWKGDWCLGSGTIVDTHCLA